MGRARHRAAGGSGGPGVTRRGGAGGSVLGRLAWRESRVAPGGPLRAAHSTPLTKGALRLAYPKASLGTAGTAEDTAGTVAPNQKQRTFAQAQIPAS